jgi:putative hemolysin
MRLETPVPEVFKLNLVGKNPVTQKVYPWLEPPLERLLAIRQINSLYAQLDRTNDSHSFLDQLLKALKVKHLVSDIDFGKIPKTGPVIVVANHPFGMIEGIILAQLLSSVRRDVRILANVLLGTVQPMRDLLIMTDPFEKPESLKSNYKALKQGIQWLKQQGMLVVFPAGEVAHWHLSRRSVTDPKWHDTVARLVKLSGAPVLPIFFNGGNNALFQLLGLVHPFLRTMMLPQQLVNKQHKIIEARIGNLIPFRKLNEFDDYPAMTEFLRARTYLLKHGTNPRKKLKKFTPVSGQQPVFAPVDSWVLAQEVGQLPPDQHLLTSGACSVFYARSTQIPHLLQEIGRLREVTFRAVGEGTGKTIDLDEFDAFYFHLFIWQNEKQEVVGAYRIGASEEILPERGQNGFYTSTLFHLKPRLLEQIRPALELGRSFIRLEYQRHFTSLLLLWQGISHFVSQRPEYKNLFGPVSISNDYTPASRQLLISFLKMNNYLPEMAKFVKPKTPPKHKHLKEFAGRKTSLAVDDLKEVSELISNIEKDCKGVPILIKQYLKMGGKLLGFNIDRTFGNVVDGLILVDLTQTDPKALERYMGKERLEQFLQYHKDRV